jgi:hypothetical protein
LKLTVNCDPSIFRYFPRLNVLDQAAQSTAAEISLPVSQVAVLLTNLSQISSWFSVLHSASITADYQQRNLAAQCLAQTLIILQKSVQIRQKSSTAPATAAAAPPPPPSAQDSAEPAPVVDLLSLCVDSNPIVSRAARRGINELISHSSNQQAGAEIIYNVILARLEIASYSKQNLQNYSFTLLALQGLLVILYENKLSYNLEQLLGILGQSLAYFASQHANSTSYSTLIHTLGVLGQYSPLKLLCNAVKIEQTELFLAIFAGIQQQQTPEIDNSVDCAAIYARFCAVCLDNLIVPQFCFDCSEVELYEPQKAPEIRQNQRDFVEKAEKILELLKYFIGYVELCEIGRAPLFFGQNYADFSEKNGNSQENNTNSSQRIDISILLQLIFTASSYNLAISSEFYSVLPSFTAEFLQKSFDISWISPTTADFAEKIMNSLISIYKGSEKLQETSKVSQTTAKVFPETGQIEPKIIENRNFSPLQGFFQREIGPIIKNLRFFMRLGTSGSDWKKVFPFSKLILLYFTGNLHETQLENHAGHFIPMFLTLSEDFSVENKALGAVLLLYLLRKLHRTALAQYSRVILQILNVNLTFRELKLLQFLLPAAVECNFLTNYIGNFSGTETISLGAVELQGNRQFFTAFFTEFEYLSMSASIEYQSIIELYEQQLLRIIIITAPPVLLQFSQPILSLLSFFSKYFHAELRDLALHALLLYIQQRLRAGNIAVALEKLWEIGAESWLAAWKNCRKEEKEIERRKKEGRERTEIKVPGLIEPEENLRQWRVTEKLILKCMVLLYLYDTPRAEKLFQSIAQIEPFTRLHELVVKAAEIAEAK